MIEQQPNRLKILNERLDKTNSYIAKLDRVSKTIGTPAFTRRFDLTTKTGEEFLETVIKVGQVKESLEEKARPVLALRQKQIQNEINVLKDERVAKNEERVAQIRRFVEKGLIGQEILENAQKELDKLKQQLLPVQAPILITQKPITVEPEIESPREAAEKPVFTKEEQLDESIVFPNGKRPLKLSVQERLALEGLLCGSKDKPVSTTELIKLVWDEKVSISVGRERLGTALGKLRKKIKPADYKIVNLTPLNEGVKGKGGIYYLEEIETIPEEKPVEKPVLGEKKPFDEEKRRKYQEMYMLFDITLPDGKVIKVQGKLRAEALKLLIAAFDRNGFVQTDVGTIAIYGAYNRETYGKFYSLMGVIRKDLKPHGFGVNQPVRPFERAQGQKARYSLIKIEEEQPSLQETATPVEVFPEDSTLLPKELLPHEIASEELIMLLNPQEPEVTVIPYSPTEEEKRTPEETRILDAIVSDLLIYHGKLKFEELQAKLYSKDREKPVLGEKLIIIYQGYELKEKFVSALNKLREETVVSQLRTQWSEDEKALWDKIQTLIADFHGGDVTAFIKKVKDEISRSEKQFYKDYPPQQGFKVTWIRKEINGQR